MHVSNGFELLTDRAVVVVVEHVGVEFEGLHLRVAQSLEEVPLQQGVAER